MHQHAFCKDDQDGKQPIESGLKKRDNLMHIPTLQSEGLEVFDPAIIERDSS